MQDSADTARFFGGGAMPLTVDAQGTAATVSDPGGIKHAYRPIMFTASLLWKECCSLLATQRAVSLEGKLGETHRGGPPLLTEFLAQIPDPLRKDLPDLLSVCRVGTPPITVLLT